MGEEVGYEDALRALRASLAEAAGNARVFAIRSRGAPRLLSAHSWGELAEIETLLVRELVLALRNELRVEPWSYATRLRAGWRGVLGGLRPEAGLVAGLLRELLEHPVERWRAGAPQLEAGLWPFFSARTRYLANTFALALNEPAPHAPLIWHPGRREFTARSRTAR